MKNFKAIIAYGGGGTCLNAPYGYFDSCKSNKICYNSDMKYHIFNGVCMKKNALTLAEGAAHVVMPSCLDKHAFTLAEVLITLGIIGVVAAMTLPVLIQSYKNNIVETRLQKFYSVMNQAIKMAEVEHGDKKEWYQDVGGVEVDGEGNPIEGSSKVLNWYNIYLAKYITTTKITVDSRGIPTFYLADGSAFRPSSSTQSRDWRFFPSDPQKCMTRLKTDAERQGRCMFGFEFYPILKNSDWNYLYDKGFEPTLFQWDGTENWLKNDSGRGCYINGGNHVYCTAVIWYNGWKIPKDYPWRVSP